MNLKFKHAINRIVQKPQEKKKQKKEKRKWKDGDPSKGSLLLQVVLVYCHIGSKLLVD